LERKERIFRGDALVQRFYEGPKKCDCCTNWIEREPEEVPVIIKDRYDKATNQVFKSKDHESPTARLAGLSPMQTRYIEVQSQIIADAIRPILIDVGMLIAKTESIKIRSPFRELYFAYSRILEVQQGQNEGTEQRGHLDVLVKVMRELLSDSLGEIADLHAKSNHIQVSLDHLPKRYLRAFTAQG